jgi:integrase/recombinase XerD
MGITNVEVDPARTGTRKALAETRPGQAREYPSGDLVQWFLDYYWIRHPISQEALGAYRVELLALDHWLSTSRSKSLGAADGRDLREYFGSRLRTGKSQSGGLPSLTCVRRFYFYLMEVGLRRDDPTEQLYVRSPRLVRSNLEVVPRRRS